MEVNKITMEEEEAPRPGDGSKQTSMERVELTQLHRHPLIPFTRFTYGRCDGYRLEEFIYGGYRCNELGCDKVVFHKECFNPIKEINHSFHPDHPLKLIVPTIPFKDSQRHTCFCGKKFKVGYCCSICDFKLDLECARRPEPLVVPESSYRHEHPLKLETYKYNLGQTVLHPQKICKECKIHVNLSAPHYRCQECKEFVVHLDCLDLFPDVNHTSHPQHPLKPLRGQVPDYADKKCLLCEEEFDQKHHKIHHCDVCNVSICRACFNNPPPVKVECPKTHDEHQLHLVPRLIDFTCNACGTKGSRSPYFCLQCNFMIHRECIDLPRVININRHDHRLFYTPRLGHGEWKCKVCRKKVDGFYGAYTCSKCPTFAAHARCATRRDVWDMVEREGTPEEEEIAPYEVIDDNTIRHFSHDHDLLFNKDGMILSESTLCNACIFQIGSEPSYICKEQQCDFILHEKCANLPRKKRHVLNNLPFTLHTDSHFTFCCQFCNQYSTGFRYVSRHYVDLDVRCASISDSVDHKSHPHPIYYSTSEDKKRCSRCKKKAFFFFRCDKDDCDYILDVQCAILPEKVMKNRYDDHPLYLSYGDMNVNERYWCEACETKLDPKRGFYTCNDSGVVLHISCLFGDFSYIMPGSFVLVDFDYRGDAYIKRGSVTSSNEEVVSNTSTCRPLCYMCKSRCKLPSVLKVSKGELVVHICSLKCRFHFRK